MKTPSQQWWLGRRRLEVPLIPVTLLTGFLGSGKTTLLSQLLRDSRFADAAVVVNEFGEVGLDPVLVEHTTEQLVEMTSGCLCCTIRGDIRAMLLDLHERRRRGACSSFGRLIVETTGLADPAPVIHTLMMDSDLARRFTLGGVVTTVDAINGERTFGRHAECMKQIAVADRIVLTKTDMVRAPASRADLTRLKAALRRLNPGAPVLDRNAPCFDLARLFDGEIYDPTTKSFDVQRWLNAEAYEDRTGHHHHHDHHHHDVNRHGANIHAYSLVLDQPLSMMAFTVALELLIANQGPDLLRVKGIVHVTERPEGPVVLHGVQHVFHEPVWLDGWTGPDRHSRLVFIVRDIPKARMEAFFAAWQKAAADQTVLAATVEPATSLPAPAGRRVRRTAPPAPSG